MNNQFDPSNEIVKICLKAMMVEIDSETDKSNKLVAKNLLKDGYEKSTSEMEKVVTAYFIGKIEDKVEEKVRWFNIALDEAIICSDNGVRSTISTLYNDLALAYMKISEMDIAKKYTELSEKNKEIKVSNETFYHGTKADLKVGDLLEPGFGSNYKENFKMNHVYFTALLNGAGLAAALAKGEGRERVYIVEPMGEFENDPNVTDKKFPGNLTRSFRSTKPIKIIGEVTYWKQQSNTDKVKWLEKVNKNNGEILN